MKPKKPKSKCGGLAFFLDKPVYCSGEEISGMIIVSISSVYPGKELLLNFIGKERVQ
jgi:hypothetical protein